MMFKKFLPTPKKQLKKRGKKKPLFYLSKRKRLVIVSSLTALGVLGLSSFEGGYKYLYIGGLSLLAGMLTLWALREDLKKITWFLTPILPMLFMISVYLFYFLLQDKLITKIIFFILFGVGMYAILLTENILSVSALRTIQLLRAAQALSFLFSLIVAFLMFDAVFSFYFNPFYNFLLIFGISIFLCLQGVWSGSLEEKISSQVWSYSLALALILGEGALFVSMWPVNIIVASLFLVTILYVGLGLIQQFLAGRLFKTTIKEYMRVGILVFMILLALANW